MAHRTGNLQKDIALPGLFHQYNACSFSSPVDFVLRLSTARSLPTTLEAALRGFAQRGWRWPPSHCTWQPTTRRSVQHGEREHLFDNHCLSCDAAAPFTPSTLCSCRSYILYLTYKTTKGIGAGREVSTVLPDVWRVRPKPSCAAAGPRECALKPAEC